MPFSNLSPFIKKTLNKNIILDYNLTLQDNTFQINQIGCTLKWPLAIAYALSVVTIGNPKKITKQDMKKMYEYSMSGDLF